ncbi:hypothetical protein [Mesorhizobium japonicum]|uniref:Mll0482 protein n=1 Tax=Mesorhizobium japonicum (strain LMG 29417 / CECT 9101 / MAFF 303099) TaxID=266835 RepID=Q98MQ2_RHILO|nr:hypothetical protein [Mesorhizobium japonicum]BAB48061.1 mll0482 [Mesorhizobium japonicum MAFF 303099]
MIKDFKRIDGASSRGSLFQWNYNGSVISAFWPNEYSTMSPDIDAAASALNNGVLAAGNAVIGAAERLKRTDEIRDVSLEAIARYVAAPFRYLRDRAIDERNSVGISRNSLAQPIQIPNPTPFSIAADSLERQEVRRMLDGFDQIGEAFDWVMQSPGITVLNAVAPSIDLTIFSKDQQLAGLIVEEFAIRKWARTIDNPSNDNLATAANPLKNKMSDDLVRDLAKARLDGLKLREQAVSDAEKLLLAVIAFASQAGNLTPDEAFKMLMGQKVA